MIDAFINGSSTLFNFEGSGKSYGLFTSIIVSGSLFVKAW